MRISELSRRSGVSNATIKFYLREGLLPAGRATAATQAEYSEQHLRRLRLIRALIGVRGLTVQQTRDVLGAVSEYGTDLHQVLGLVLGARPVDTGAGAESEDGDGDGDEKEPGRSEVDELVAEMGWEISPHSAAQSVIAETLETMRSLGADYGWRSLVPYARIAEETAVLDLDQLKEEEDLLERAERAILLTILLEPALLALRRLAQENESAKRHSR
ncbi:putative MerR family transcriptional regulator [Actinacidiphila reveromycinica]|uniref:Putative MerR family transcriptional regulator n=1 Tax=Actinacidiphila reveromycinica TaxID=659352 RepID=A0A7U3UTS0_9ACTN|nr:MerR family transcriptional regulator [Streptomyces sp. SN-593]BBB00141.1 putative MerR family transcriptional regulator [Streptomyces sp. SN-593]